MEGIGSLQDPALSLHPKQIHRLAAACLQSSDVHQGRMLPNLYPAPAAMGVQPQPYGEASSCLVRVTAGRAKGGSKEWKNTS